MSPFTTPNNRFRPVLIQPVLLTFVAVSIPAFDRAAQTEEPSVERRAQLEGDDWFQPEADAELLKRVLDEKHVSDRWIYNDLDA